MNIILIPNTNKLQGDVIAKFINPGELFFGDSKYQIHTILGSCIAITLWHPYLKLGGMCHFVLPGKMPPDKNRNSESIYNGRYSDDAITLLEKTINQYNTNIKEYQAKVFGGSNMLTHSSLKDDELIGTRNARAALNLLIEREIVILVADVGETGHRRISFDIDNGDVWVKHTPLQKTIPMR